MQTQFLVGKSGGGETLPRTISNNLKPARTPAQPVVLLILFASADLTLADIFTVNNTNQTGTGSLRQAILDANVTPGTNVIQFTITNPTPSITITNPLPDITNPVIIDGTTQPGSSNSPIVELNGANFGTAQDGLRINTSNSVIRGLVINRFSGDGIEVTNASDIRIEGNFIGLNVAGTTDQGNFREGILLTNSFNCVIGGIYATQRNVISGNTLNGVLAQGTNPIVTSHVLLGNYIGLSANGSNAVGNSALGVYLNNVASNTVGSLPSGARNLISANSQHGVGLQGTNATGNLVLGNYIGLDVSGLVDRGNGAQGVYLLNAPTNTVGGASAAARNFISGNGQAGVRLEGNTARGNVVMGNLIGTDASGALGVANSSHGVHFFSTAAHGNFVGGTHTGEPNVIAFNGGDGIYVQAGTNNALRANAIFSNTGLGIDLGNDGVQVHDPGDSDSGANELQNFPFLTNATYSAGGVTVNGSLHSRPSRTYALDFFANVLADPATNGEGQVYLGSTNVTTGADSNATFAVTFPLVAAGRWISATATDTNGNTSEFSPCVRADSTLAPQTFTVTTTSDSGPGSLRQALTAANNAPAASNNLIAFAIPGSGVRTVAVFSTLPTIVEPAIIDGFTQTGSSSNSLSVGNNAVWLIRLDGVSAGAGVDGLKLLASSNVVRGLLITRFSGDGIEATNGGNNIIVGNCIGVNENGVSQGNSADGILVINSAGNRIGGTLPAERNILSGNSSDGVEVNGLASSNNVIRGNYFGPDPGGTLDRRNSANGIYVNGAPHNTIGGTAAGEGNVISRNQSDGVEISGLNATNTLVLGNTIGLDASGTASLGNFAHGVFLTGNARFNFLGATNPGAGNRIAFNAGDGIYLPSGTNNASRGNNIWSNSALGIDLDTDGITVNDAGDNDTGANLRQNFPVLTNAVLSPGNTLIEGTLNSRTNAAFFLDFFASFTRDAITTNGEGQVYLGSATVTTGADSNAAFSVSLPVTAAGGRWITATATDSNGNTSEFSTARFATTLLPGQSFTVLTTNNSGPGSLREAIARNNLTFNGAPNLINFAIPGLGPYTISPVTALPAVTLPVVIDGYTQSGSSSNTLAHGNNAVLQIRLDGLNLGSFDGLTLTGPSNTVRGLAIVRFNGDGLELGPGGYNVIEGNFIGLDTDGVTVRSNTADGIHLASSPGNLIGGTTPAARNIVSGNVDSGIEFNGAGATNNLVLGNFIGTDATGALDRGNNVFGVNLGFDAPANTVGGTAAGARNVISGNNSGGVNVSSAGHVIQGNHIGADVTGTLGVPNGGDGVYVSLSGTGGNLIGGTNAGAGNLISFNSQAGVRISFGTNHTIRANIIYSNAALGIDLGADYNVTANDPGDYDGGGSGNDLQNFPLITSALITLTNTTVQGTLNSRTNTTYQIDLFANLFPDASGNGEGQQFLGSTTLTTGADSNGAFNVTLPVVVIGGKLAATATDPFGNTSEFSPAFTPASTFPAQTFTVINTNDSGPGSLRDAIITNNASYNGGNNLIAFSIPGPGPHIITPLTPLPTITRSVTIDGYTQSGATSNSLAGGFNGALKIRLDGISQGASRLLGFTGVSNIVRGLALTRSGYTGLEFTMAGNVVEGCLIGLDETGANAGNASYAVYVLGAGNRIGGTTPASRNVISRNGLGVAIFSAGAIGNRVEGNFIGTDLSGTSFRGNSGHGVYVDGVSNVIGGTVAGAGNVISANGGDNLSVGFSALETRIQGNLIGTDVTGAMALGGGVRTYQATNTLIGGPTPAARNVVSGITIDSLSQGTRVLGNYIGTDVTGTLALGGPGVTLNSASGNAIGGTNSGEANIIAFGNNAGVTVSFGTNNPVRGNSIFANNSLGIDLISGNNHQPPPVITNAIANPGATAISGTVTGAPNATLALDFYSNPACDASGFGEGRTYLGSSGQTLDGSGNGAFSVTLPVVIAGRVLTATATDANGNTSEFSACALPVVNLLPVTLVVTNTNDRGPGSLREALLAVDAALANGRDTIAFNIPGAGVRTIAPLSPLPSTIDPVIIDGFTQPGSSTNSLPEADNAVRLIQLDGINAGSVSGLVFTNPNNVVRGLEIQNFPGSGIELHSDGNLIAGNLIRSNGNDGILINPASNNTIGGTTPAARNIIAANGSSGVRVAQPTAAGNVIQGNLIGTDPTGLLDWGNTYGINLESAVNTLIGGAATGARNVISGNSFEGILLSSLTSALTTNRILGNYIGTTANGLNSLSNGLNGITIISGSGTTIGGTNAGEANRIAFNGADGVSVSAGTNHALRANAIFGNGGAPFTSGLGIDLGNNGVTTNDAGDVDLNANFSQNYPIITNAVLTTSNVLVQGFLSSRSNTIYELDFFANSAPDVSAFGEGEAYLGSIAVTTVNHTNASFSVIFPLPGAGRFLTATATDPFGNTSEFGPPLKASSIVPAQTFTVINTNDSGAGSFRAAITAHNTAYAITNNTIAFNIPGSGVRIVSPLSALPTITEPVILNGYSQPGTSPNTLSNGFDGVLRIRLDGLNAGGGGVDGLRFTSSSNAVQGLIITRFSGDGIEFAGSSNNVIQGNLIGLDGVPPPAMLGDGRGWHLVTTGNRMDGIHFVDSPFNLVGDTVAGARNVITKNLGNGLRFETGSSGNYVGNTYLGTDPTGTLGVGNGKDGVKVEFGANNIQIVKSVIAGNNGYGVNAGQGTVVDRCSLFGNGGGINSSYPGPDLNQAENLGSLTQVGGTAFGGPFAPLNIQLARNSWNFAGQYQFEKFEKEFTVIPNSMGIANWTTTITPPLKVGERVTAISIESVLGSSRISLAREVTAPTEADVEIVSIEPSPNPTRGGPVTITVTVRNNGPATATGIYWSGYGLADHRDIYVLSQSASQGNISVQGGVLFFPPSFLWNIGSLAPGATVTATIEVKSYELGVLMLQSGILASSPDDPDFANNYKSRTVHLIEPGLTHQLAGNELVISTPLWTVPGSYEWTPTLSPANWQIAPLNWVARDNDSVNLHVNTQIAPEGYYRFRAEGGLAPATLKAEHLGNQQLKLSVDSWYAPGVFQSSPTVNPSLWQDMDNPIFGDSSSLWTIDDITGGGGSFYRFVGNPNPEPPVLYRNNVLVLSGPAPADSTVRIDLNRDGSWDYEIKADCYGRYTVALDVSQLNFVDQINLQYFDGDTPLGGTIARTVVREFPTANHAAEVPVKHGGSEAALCTTCQECCPETQTAAATGMFDGSNAPRDASGSGVELANGRVRTQVPIVSFATRGQGINFGLVHSSLQDYDSPYGQGFSHSYNYFLVRVNPTTVDVYTPSRGPYTAISPDNGRSWMLPEGFNATLNFNSKSASWCLRHFSGQEFNFFDAPVGVPGYVTSICGPDKNTTLLDYNGRGNLTGITSDLGQKIKLEYSQFPHLESVTDHLGRTWRFVYDAAFRLTQISYPETEFANVAPGTLLTDTQLPAALVTAARTVTLAYTNTSFSNQITSVTDPRGAVPKAYVYDGQGRVSSAFINGKEVRYFYDPTNNPLPLTKLEITNTITRVIDREGNVTDYEIHSAGGMLSIIDGQVATAGRFGLRRMVTWTETGKGNAPLRAGEPLYWEQRWLHDCDCLAPRVVTQPFSSVEAGTLAFDINKMPFFWPRTIYTYNANRQVLSESYTDGVQSNRTEYTYGGPWLRMLTHKEWRAFDTNALYAGLNFTHTYEYDGDGNLTNHIAPSVTRGVASTQAVQERWTYNPFGQVLTYSDPNGNLTTYAYHTNPSTGGGINAKGSFAGYLASVTRGATGSADPAVNLTQSFKVNALGLITQATDPNGNVRDYEYNALGELVRELEPAVTLRNGSTHRYENRYVYDAAGNMVLARRSNLDLDGVLLPNTFADRSMSYDAGNNLVAERQEVDVADANDLLTRYAYDGNDERAIIQKPEGNRIFRLYDERGLLFKEFTGVAADATLTNGYPADKRAEQLGATAFVGFTRQDYDARGNLVRSRDQRAYFTDHFFDFNNRQVAEADPNGNGWRVEYDDASNPLTTERGAVSKSNGLLTQLLSRSYTRFDELGRGYQTAQDLNLDTDERVAVDPAAGGGNPAWLTRYDASSRVQSRLDANGNPTTFVHDAANRVRTATDALGNVRNFSHDPNSNVTNLNDLEKAGPGATGADENHVTEFHYDQLNRRIATRVLGLNGNSLDHTTRFAYDSRSNLRLIQDAEDNYSRLTYDDLNRLTRIQRYAGDWFNGSPAELFRSERAYDRNGRRTEDRTFSDVTNTASAQVSHHAYDAVDRVVRTVSPDSDDPIDGSGNGMDGVFDRMEFAYDANSNPTRVTEPRGVVFTNSYDAGNRLIQQNLALPASVPGTTRQEFQYDELNRLTSARNNYARVDRSFDSLSRFTNEVQSIRLDGSGFVNGWDQPIQVACGFDRQANRTNCTILDGALVDLAVSRTYDALNRADLVAAAYFGIPSHPIADYAYFGPGRIQTLGLGNGAKRANVFDVKRRLASLTWRDATNTLLAGFEYSDPAGNGYDRMDNPRYERLLHDGNRYDHFRYNRRYELTGVEYRSTSATPPVIPANTFAYDDAFNRRNASFGSPFNETSNTVDVYSINAANEYTQIIRNATPRNPIHDAAGNLATLPVSPVTAITNQSDVDASARWDGWGQLFDLDAGVNPPQHYRYDPFRRRIAVLNSTNDLGGSRRFIYDGWEEIEERVFNPGATLANAPSTLERICVQGQRLDEPLLAAIDRDMDRLLGGANSKNRRTDTADQEYYFLGNRSGNVMALLDADNASRILEYCRYTPHGEVTLLPIVDTNANGLEDTPADLADNAAAGAQAFSAEFANPFLFASRRFDDRTGLYNFRHRYYEARTGIFVSRDPLRDRDRLGSRYAFARNNPVSGSDPLGLWTIEIGVGGQGGCVKGANGSVGIVIEIGGSTGWFDLGLYGSFGSGTFVGASGGAGVEVGVSPDNVEDLEGASAATGGSALVAGLEFESPNSATNWGKGKVSVGIKDFGFPVEGHSFTSHSGYVTIGGAFQSVGGWFWNPSPSPNDEPPEVTEQRRQATDEKIKQQKAEQAAQSQIHTGIIAPAGDPFVNINSEDLAPRTGPKNGSISVTRGTGRTATGIGRSADRRGTGTVRVTSAPDPCDKQTRDVQVTNQQRNRRGAVRHAVVTRVNP